MSSPKRLALIGHRGVGKTSLLSRIEKYYRADGRRIRIFDLDREIEQQAGRSISAIFHDEGEAVFRRLETSTLEKLEKEIVRVPDDVVIALGAGFPVAVLKKEWHAIWIRRPSDETGRIFTDRPRLDAKISALEEFQLRSIDRTPRFAERADDILLIDEGADDVLDPAEQLFFQDRIRMAGGALTVQPENFVGDFKSWADRRVAWGLRWFELRDDLLSLEQFTIAARLLPRDKILVSYRDVNRERQTEDFIESFGLAFDWPLELGRTAAASPFYFSLHAREGSIESSLQRLEAAASLIPGVHLKAALMIENFDELSVGHAWQIKDPATRVFLPMSKNGRWSWYRLLRGNDLSLNFIRESSGSSADQPTLLQWVRRNLIRESASFENKDKFAAVLGDPVSHSRTPMEQAEFFRKKGLGVSAVQLSEDEWRAGAVDQLISLGLVAAAVTAPLKKLAFETATLTDDVAQELGSINTLYFSKGISGLNTDLSGLKEAVTYSQKEFASARAVAVWGGGGTLDVLRRVFPRAQFVSVRTQGLRDTGAVAAPPDVVVWAASLKDQISSPPKTWKPKVIFDLNYSEASPGRDYALQTGARYISGLAMFKAQAQAQRDFWNARWDEDGEVS